MYIQTGDFRDFECPHAHVVFTDPPYGLGKRYKQGTESTPYKEWVWDIYEWCKDRTGWLIVLGPMPTLEDWLGNVPPYHQLIFWHRTFILPGRKLSGWTPSLTPVLVYNFGGEWLGPTKPDREWHDVIDGHSSLGDIKRMQKLGIHERVRLLKHPAVTGTHFPRKVLPAISRPGDVLVDPMAGIGSILVAGLRLGLRVQGFEIEPDYANVGNEWLMLEGEISQVD